MSRSLLLIFLFYFSLIISSSAQENGFITGKVLDSENGLPAHDVSILFFSQKNVVYRTSSDSLGIFKASVRFTGGLDSIKFTSFTYKTYVIRKQQREDLYKNGSFGVFKLKSVIVQLGEVKIKSDKRYRDTTKIDLSGQKFERDIMIDDLFSQYGFSKDSNGQIYYKGKPVTDMVVNGKDFFKNNKEIFNLLPALALNGIEVTQTNIDSTTNTTTLHPILKVNLKLKDQYNKGRFGNGNLALGTQKRNLVAANVYSYKNDEQVTINANTNNINIGNSPFIEPVIGFSATGNDVRTHNLMINYHNILFKKLEVNFLAKGNQEVKNYRSESVREDEALNQSSTISNSSHTNSHGLSDINLSLIYKIDSLNNVSLTHTGNYYKTTLNDSLKYVIQYQDVNSVSSVNKNRVNLKNTANTEATYKHMFADKKGRQIDITAGRKSTSDKNTEEDIVYSLNNNAVNSYFISGNQNLIDRTYSFRTSFTEPLSNYSSYINLFAAYSNSFINYKPTAISDSLNVSLQPAELTNQYLQSGIKYQKTLSKVSLDVTIKGLLNLRRTTTIGQKNNLNFFDLNGDLNTDYRFNDKKSLKLTLQRITEYPETYQFVNVNNSFDLISQMANNVNLKPQVKNRLSVEFSNRRSNTESINIGADVNYYLERFGMNINAQPNASQLIFVDNIGNAITSNINVNISRNVFQLSVNSYSMVSYFEQPTIINGVLNKNSGFNISQSISVNKSLVENILSVSPTLGGTYGRYFYSSSPVSAYTLNYSDKVTLTAAKFELGLYPLATYSHSINNLFSFSMNAGIKRKIFKNYGLIWIQGYDIFNSFKMQNNLFGPSYKQTIQYSNINRYVILGLSFKFNNIN
jgi:hypothetical protein